jgi:hypothetical protein
VVRSSSPVVRPRPRPSTGNRTGCRKRDRVQALVDVAVTYLETLPGEPADDHTVVMVHVNAEALDVPAGTSVESGTCHVEGHGPIEPATAERLLCTAKEQGVLVGRGGKVLILGRTKASRDPAVTHGAKGPRQGHLLIPRPPRAAHHIIAWSHGAPTDLHTPAGS